MVTREQLEKLKEPMPYKWRVQSTKYGRCTVVAYVDSRQVQDKLDECLGADNWQNEFKLIDGKLFGGIGVRIASGESSEWIWKWDTGVESNVDKEKGQVSDSMKRAAVHFGVGRFLYSLGIVTLNSKQHTNNKEYPATRDGKILWNAEELNAYVSKIVAEGVLDDTKPQAPKPTPAAPKANESTPATPKAESPAKDTKKASTKKVETPKLDPKASALDEKGNIKANDAFVEELMDERQAKALAFFKEFDGVNWVKVKAFSKISLKDDPEAAKVAFGCADAKELITKVSVDNCLLIARALTEAAKKGKEEK